MDPTCLQLEIAESALSSGSRGSAELVSGLKRLGAQLVIDDFGTRFSPMSYLRNFAIDSIKIDRSFIRDIGTDSIGAAIVIALIELARVLHIGVTAEGVETESQRDFLVRNNCAEAQGFLFSRPLTTEDATALLGAGKAP